jgi:CTP synthase
LAKYIFVSGGVVSSVGKGITVASLGRLLKSRGIAVSVVKLDPYINVDPGTMNPYQHGEVFVTDDGAETDLDLGHYERFIDANLGQVNSVSTGQVYSAVISRERRGDFLGGTIQVIPHITNEIKERIQLVAKQTGAEVVIAEVGGTVGDIECLPFLEATRQMHLDLGRQNMMYIHLTLLPYIAATKELKTKPTQHSVKDLRSIGIQPDVIICRSDFPVSREMKDKIALFCDVDSRAVIPLQTVPTIYEVPLILEEEGLGDLMVERLGLDTPRPALDDWRALVRSALEPTEELVIGLVGKYVELNDAYLSVAAGTQRPSSGDSMASWSPAALAIAASRGWSAPRATRGSDKCPTSVCASVCRFSVSSLPARRSAPKKLTAPSSTCSRRCP